MTVLKLSSANSNTLDPTDAQEIQAVIQKAYDLEVKAARDFDTSAFAEVFVNDARVSLDPSTIAFVKSVKVKIGQTPRDDYGFLDYKIAYYELWQAGALASEALREKAQQENRDLTPEENQSLAGNMPRAQGPGKRVSLVFHSITGKGDRASAVFDDGPRINQFQLVKINSQWYIAGWTILEVHA